MTQHKSVEAEQRGPSDAYFEAMNAMAAHIESRPFPTGINTVDAGDWTLTANTAHEPVRHNGMDYSPFSLIAQHKRFFVIAALDPAGGCIGGGMSEADFIAEMRALSSARGNQS